MPTKPGGRDRRRQIDGLSSLMFGNGNAAKTGEPLFRPEPSNESHGLLGKIVVAR